MALYEAVRVLLVDEGPLLNLYADRLPPEQTDEVDTVFIRQGGGPPQRYLGSSPIANGAPGVTHDGGILWHVANVQFQLRSVDAEVVMEVADRVRDLLIQFSGGSLIRAGEEAIRVDLTASPHFFKQDEKERVILALGVEIWHRTA